VKLAEADQPCEQAMRLSPSPNSDLSVQPLCLSVSVGEFAVYSPTEAQSTQRTHREDENGVSSTLDSRLKIGNNTRS